MFWWFFKHTAHFSMDLPFFFVFCVLLPHLFFPPPIFLAFLVLSLFGIFYHTSRACFMCICSFHVLCLVFVFIATHVFCTVWVYCARFSTQTVFGGFLVHIYLVLLFAGFLCVPFFSSVGQSSRGYFPKFLVCFSIQYVSHLLSCICEAEF